MHTFLITLLASTLAHALPQAEIDHTKEFPVITFADCVGGSWTKWNYMKKDDLEKELLPRPVTIRSLDKSFSFENGGKYTPCCLQL